MTTHTTNYARAEPGQLEIIFRAVHSFAVSGDAGIPATGAADILLECTVSNGAGQLAKTYVSRDSPSAHVILAYPGGGTVWTAAVTDVATTFGGGLGSMSVVPYVNFVLIKK